MKKHGWKTVLLFAVLLLLILAMLYSGLQILESTVLHQADSDSSGESKTLTVDGVDYYPRQDITTVMVLGIDNYGPVESSGYYRNEGDADMVLLLIFDDNAETCSVLCLNRDTMLDMPVLGLHGETVGTFYGQLALAHTYGSGLADSCENVKTTLENFLTGLSIDYYVSLNMDAISVLNDAVGGVTVEVVDDFSAIDPSIGSGTVKLDGDQAVTFVRTRKDLGDQLNVSRMERHEAYINGFLDALLAANAADSSFIYETYDAVQPYIVTDCSANTLSSLINRCGSYALKEIVSPEGTNTLGTEHYEFQVDPEALSPLLLRLFYAPKG